MINKLSETDFKIESSLILIENGLIPLYFFFIFILIWISPKYQHLKNKDTSVFINWYKLVVRHIGFSIVILIRGLHIFKTLGLHFVAIYSIIEYVLFYINTMKYGILDLINILTKKMNFDASGTMFLFSFSSYLLLKTYMNNDDMRITIPIIIVLFIFHGLAIRTIMYYHTKMECMVGVLCSIFISAIHGIFSEQ